MNISRIVLPAMLAGLVVAMITPVSAADEVIPPCDVTLQKVECYGLCRVSYLDAGGLVHGHCLGIPILEPTPCYTGLDRVECYGICRVSYLDAGGLVHGHCLGIPILE